MTGASESGVDVVFIRAPYDTVTGNRQEWPGAKISALKEGFALVGVTDRGDFGLGSSQGQVQLGGHCCPMSGNTRRPRNLLLTGASGVGKSTLLKKVGYSLKGRKIRGFFGEAIWEGGQRKGWRLDTFAGDGGTLAHVDIHSQYNMGEYGVDMVLFDRLVDSQLHLGSDVDVYLVDEIGIIAPWSTKFVSTMNALLDSSRTVVAIIRTSGGGYVRQVKDRTDVEIWEVTQGNREQILDKILAWIAKS